MLSGTSSSSDAPRSSYSFSSASCQTSTASPAPVYDYTPLSPSYADNLAPPFEQRPSFLSPNTASFPISSPATQTHQQQQQRQPSHPSHRRSQSASSCRSATFIPPRPYPGAATRKANGLSTLERKPSSVRSGDGRPRLVLGEKSDVCILVPRPDLMANGTARPSSSPQHQLSRSLSSATDGSLDAISNHELSAKRRGSAPTGASPTVTVYRLHARYLSHCSTYFAKLLSNPPHQLIPCYTSPSTVLDNAVDQPSSASTRSTTVPVSRIPTYYVNGLPDPSSLKLVIHYIYHANPDVVEEALSSGQVDWKGFFATINFLGVQNSLKVVCARWWKRHIKPSTLPSSAPISGSPSLPSFQIHNRSRSSSTFSIAPAPTLTSTGGSWAGTTSSENERGRTTREDGHLVYDSDQDTYALEAAVGQLRL